MRFFMVAADVAMGLFLGLFLFAVLLRLFPSFDHPATAVTVIALSILIVLFRRPNGSLAMPRHRS